MRFGNTGGIIGAVVVHHDHLVVACEVLARERNKRGG
jgi:hypothetical protein